MAAASCITKLIGVIVLTLICMSLLGISINDTIIAPLITLVMHRRTGGRQAEATAVLKYAQRRAALGLDTYDTIHAPVNCHDTHIHCPINDIYPVNAPLLPSHNTTTGRAIYGTIDRVTSLTHERFKSDYLHRGQPVIVTDAGHDWIIAQWNLSTFATIMGDAQVVPRSARKQRGNHSLNFLTSISQSFVLC
jgi:hypothetical protein